MFDRYTEAARRAIFFAAYDSIQRNEGIVSAEHILLGLTWESSSAVENVVHLKAHAADLREYLQMPPLPGPPLQEVPLSATQLNEDAKQTILYAAEEAKLDGLYWIDSDHLLRALLRFPNRGGEALLRIGINLDGLRSSLASYRLRFPPPSPPKWEWVKTSIARHSYLRRWLVMMGLILVLALVIVAMLKLRGPV